MKSLCKCCILFVLISSFFYGCKKEIDINNQTTECKSSIKFIYHNQTVSQTDFNSDNPDLVMFVAEDKMVYVFDNNQDFLNWLNTTTYANDVEKLENQRTEILAFAQAKGVIEEYNKTGKLKQEYLDYLEQYWQTSSNKSNLLTALYDLEGASSNSTYYVIVTPWPYGTIGSMNNKASSITGIAAVTVCYDNTFWSGTRVYVNNLGSTVNFKDIGFDNRTSSVLSL